VRRPMICNRVSQLRCWLRLWFQSAWLCTICPTRSRNGISLERKCPVTPVRLQSKSVRHVIFILGVFNAKKKPRIFYVRGCCGSKLITG
jgi:hypothetical protein